MPDADGKLRGISVPAEAWERVFGAEMRAHDHDWGQNPLADGSVLSACECPPLHTDEQLRSCRCGCHA